jgi:magnesium-transporting ATPase (P-type)
LSLSDYQAWERDYNAAMSDRENYKSLIVPIIERLESDLTLLGATAIEDKL